MFWPCLWLPERPKEKNNALPVRVNVKNGNLEGNYDTHTEIFYQLYFAR